MIDRNGNKESTYNNEYEVTQWHNDTCDILLQLLYFAF